MLHASVCQKLDTHCSRRDARSKTELRVCQGIKDRSLSRPGPRTHGAINKIMLHSHERNFRSKKLLTDGDPWTHVRNLAWK